MAGMQFSSSVLSAKSTARVPQCRHRVRVLDWSQTAPKISSRPIPFDGALWVLKLSPPQSSTSNMGMDLELAREQDSSPVKPRRITFVFRLIHPTGGADYVSPSAPAGWTIEFTPNPATHLSWGSTDFIHGSKIPPFVSEDDVLTVEVDISFASVVAASAGPVVTTAADDSLTVLRDLGTMLTDPRLSDVVVRAGGVEFKAHKAILAMRSPVFEAMFRSQFKEAKENFVDLSDEDPVVVRALLHFIYTGTIPFIGASKGKDDKKNKTESKLEQKIDAIRLKSPSGKNSHDSKPAGDEHSSGSSGGGSGGAAGKAAGAADDDALSLDSSRKDGTVSLSKVDLVRTFEEAGALFALANRFQLPNLVTLAVQNLDVLLTVDNITSALAFAAKFPVAAGAPALQRAVMDYALRNAEQVITNMAAREVQQAIDS